MSFGLCSTAFYLHDEAPLFYRALQSRVILFAPCCIIYYSYRNISSGLCSTVFYSCDEAPLLAQYYFIQAFQCRVTFIRTALHHSGFAVPHYFRITTRLPLKKNDEKKQLPHAPPQMPAQWIWFHAKPPSAF
jgi:hypothetical protein